MNQIKNKKSPWLLVSVLIFVVVIAAAAYLNFSRSSANNEIERVKQETTDIEKQIATLETENVAGAQKASVWLSEIEADEVKWSRVLNQINSLIPLDSASRENKINFLSYSGSNNGRIALNGETREQSAEPFPDVAELIEAFNNNGFFRDAQVPSISRNETATGAKKASFILNAEYVSPDAAQPVSLAPESENDESNN
ncbi:hypothetical protein GF340_04440 [Candidatus Peregrinibacteria bacterium]|nr:hypothetical protein [Candidatus Peregrinibacteria bacterium]